jgi:hypothetical protein
VTNAAVNVYEANQNWFVPDKNLVIFDINFMYIPISKFKLTDF